MIIKLLSYYTHYRRQQVPQIRPGAGDDSAPHNSAAGAKVGPGSR